MAEMTRSKEVPVQLLRWTCNPELLGFDTTKECNKTDNIIGQNRAVKAITLGLEIESPGYNIYVSGMTGTGKTTTIKNLLSQLDLKKPIPDDICYVHNFKDPDTPRAIMFPAGSGRKLQKGCGCTPGASGPWERLRKERKGKAIGSGPQARVSRKSRATSWAIRFKRARPSSRRAAVRPRRRPASASRWPRSSWPACSWRSPAALGRSRPALH